MKKIAIISAGVLPVPAVRGGAVESLIDSLLLENEVENNLDITVISIEDEKAKEDSSTFRRCNFKYIRINKVKLEMYLIIVKFFNKFFNIKLNKNRLYLNQVKRVFKKSYYDHIIIENRVDYVLPIRKITSSNLLLHIHNDYLNNEVENSEKIVNAADQILTVSKYINDRALLIKDADNKLSVLKNCINTKRFNKAIYKEYRTEFRFKHNIKDDEIVFMFSGRIHPTKGVLELIKAFKNLESKKCKLLIMGSSWYSNNSKNSFQLAVEGEASEIKEKIIFTGFVPYYDIPKMHAVADIAIVPSIWEEPAGLVVIEAMSSGLPIIASDVGGIPEYTDKKSSLLIKKDLEFVSNLTIAMDRLAENSEIRKKMGDDAREYALQFNTKKYYANFLEILNI